jgi:hypothetical protein
MLEIILPCPNCQTSLLVDEQNAGTDVLCPGCEARLTLPRDLSGRVHPLLKREEDGLLSRNHPLQRTGHLAVPPAENDEHEPAPSPHHTHLPERRGLSAEEEMRRLAALTAEPPSFDLHNVDTKGQTAFPCPACHRPIWIAGEEWGREMVCSGCNSTVVAPGSGNSSPARVLMAENAVTARQRTVLPARRQVENLTPADQPASTRQKRQPGPMSATAVQVIEPIPARGDVEISPTLRKDTPVRRKPAPEEQGQADGGDSADPAPAGPAQGKSGMRLSGARLPSFTPKHEADLSAEATGQWGGTEPQDQSPAFRRTLTFAVLTLLIAAIGFTAFILRAHFAPPDVASGDPAEEENPVQNKDWAEATIERFFNAATVEEMVKEVRHPEITLPRMQAHYARTGVPRLKVEFTDDWREVDNFMGSGVNFILTTITLDGVPNHEIALETFADGRTPRLDWEHCVAWSESPWSEFLRTTGEKPAEFRVRATPVPYYNGAYSDDKRYLCFRVSDRDNFGSCFAYCESNSNLCKLLLKAVRGAYQSGDPNRIDTRTGEGIAHVILRLHFEPQGKQFNQAVIDDLVWSDWLEP